MPLFTISNDSLVPIVQSELDSEKRLQRLVEKSLGPTFNCRFVASEFSTGATHAGRIDTLALSEENNPVILEYKKVESSDLINQSLFYLSWLADHRGDFELAARDKLGAKVEIDWSDIRVICLAPNYKRYDLHAVQVMGANIELGRYRLFANSTLYLEEVYTKTVHSSPTTEERGKDPVMVAAGKKAAATRATATYTFDERIAGKPALMIEIAQQVREYVTSLDPAIEEAPKKFYVAYKTTQNIVCMEIQRQQVLLYLKLDPGEVSPLPPNARDVSNIGHYGTGDLEYTITSEADLPLARDLIARAYRQVGA
jgi:predicted transport protein